MKKKYAGILAVLTALLLAVFLLAGCASTSVIDLNEVEGPVDVHTHPQHLFLDNENYNMIVKIAAGMYENSFPEPLVLEWTGVKKAASYNLYLSLTEDFADPRVITSETNSAEVQNLFIGADYWWKVEAVSKTGEILSGSETGHFTVKNDPPRVLYIHGITNVRDLGGWPTMDGGVIRQGLAYRTAKLNVNYSSTVLIKEDGIRVMLDDLGIRTEIDLRRLDNNEAGDFTEGAPGVLGESVKYYQTPMATTKPYLQPASYESIGRVMKIFADESNYPLFFHCSIGTDRTGIIGFLVLGLCGVSDEYIHRDYLFSNFGAIGSGRSPIDLKAYYTAIEKYEGETTQQKIRSFLRTECGVTDAEMDSIVRILKQDPKN